MRKSVSVILITLMLCSVLIGSGFIAGKRSCNDEPPETRIDTLIVIDIIRDTVPIYHTRYEVRTDSIKYIINVTDTIYIPVPIERVEYKTSEYFAIVEGFKPKLSYIETYNKTYYVDKIVNVKQKPRWGLGVQIGYGYNFYRFYPYIGVGVQYNIFTW